MFAGLGAAALSGQPEVVGALVLAGEVAYLGLLGTHSKFQRYVDAQEAAVNREASQQDGAATLRRVLKALPRESYERFERLRRQCIDLRQIAANLQHSADRNYSSPLDSMQLEGLERLLWIFLRLLYRRHALGLFLHKTDAQEIQDKIQRIDLKLTKLGADDQSSYTAKLRATLEDDLQTCNQRLENYQKAEANHRLVGLEIDRLENKIKSLAELAVNRREHDFVTSQVDEVAESMVDTEKTMAELDFATDLEDLDTEAPEVLRRMLKVE